MKGSGICLPCPRTCESCGRAHGLRGAELMISIEHIFTIIRLEASCKHMSRVHTLFSGQFCRHLEILLAINQTVATVSFKHVLSSAVIQLCVFFIALDHGISTDGLREVLPFRWKCSVLPVAIDLGMVV